MTPLQRTVLQGQPYARGFAYGKTHRDGLHDFLHEGLFRINWLRDHPLALDSARQQARRIAPHIRTQIPLVYDELLGLAAGSEMEFDDVVLLQIRREVMAQAAADCTSAG